MIDILKLFGVLTLSSIFIISILIGTNLVWTMAPATTAFVFITVTVLALVAVVYAAWESWKAEA